MSDYPIRDRAARIPQPPNDDAGDPETPYGRAERFYDHATHDQLETIRANWKAANIPDFLNYLLIDAANDEHVENFDADYPVHWDDLEGTLTQFEEVGGYWINYIDFTIPHGHGHNIYRFELNKFGLYFTIQFTSTDYSDAESSYDSCVKWGDLPKTKVVKSFLDEILEIRKNTLLMSG